MKSFLRALAVAVIFLSCTGCTSHWWGRLLVTVQPGEAVDSNGVEQVFLAVEDGVCAIYPLHRPHLHTGGLPNSIQWNSVGSESFAVTFQPVPNSTSPFVSMDVTIPVLAGGNSRTEQVDSHTPEVDRSYTVTYGNSQSCKTVLNPSAMGIHITK